MDLASGLDMSVFEISSIGNSKTKSVDVKLEFSCSDLDLSKSTTTAFDLSVEKLMSEPHSSAPSDSYSTILSNMDGNGSSSSPYVITNDHELQAVAAARDSSFVLGNDINASETDQWNGGSGFDPIGDWSNGGSFTGVFDGKGHKIHGLYIDRSSLEHVGLFGGVNDGVIVTNLALTDVDITGHSWVGGITGETGGFSDYMSNIFVSGKVHGVDYGVGGVVGTLGGMTLSSCVAVTNVTGDREVGAVVGDLKKSTDSAYYATDTGGVSTSPDSIGLTMSEMKGSDAETNMSKLDFSSTWKTVSGDYPELRNI